MGGGGGDTVTNTGLGDEQYETLSSNQTQMQADMAAQQAANEAALAEQNASMQASINAANARAAASAGAAQTATAANSGRFDTLDTSVAGVDTNVTTGFAAIQDLLDQYNTASNQQFSALNTGVTGGFEQVGNRFDTVDTATGAIQGAVDQGNVDQAQGFSDAQVNRTANAAANTTNFAEAGDALNQGFADTSNQMTQTQANVLGGQGELQTNLDTMSDTADIYATQSLQNQAGLQQGQDSCVSSFDDYVDRYGDDTRIANQTRADMQQANANANRSLRRDVGDFAQAAATGQQEVSQQVRSVDQQFAAGLASLDAGQITTARDMARVASGQTDLDIASRQNYSQLGAAFDDNGALIPTNVDQQGNTTTRQLDDGGNLLLNRFDVRGNNTGFMSINLRESLQQLSSLQMPARSSAGFTSPFVTTR